MNPSSGSVRSARRRRMHYVDRSVQRFLLIAMVALEVVLVVGSIWQLHWRLDELIAQRLYRVHLANAGTTLAQLITEAVGILSVFVAVNVVALLSAEGIWRRHENRVLEEFSALLDKAGRLDFSGDYETHRRHEVLDKVVAWRACERVRLLALRAQVAKLDAAVAAGKDPQQERAALHDLSGLLRPRGTVAGTSARSGAQEISR